MLGDAGFRRNSFVSSSALCEDLFFSVEVCNGAQWSFCEEHFKVCYLKTKIKESVPRAQVKGIPRTRLRNEKKASPGSVRQ